MSTRSVIARARADGQFEAVCCHWDGYLTHNGAILFAYYGEPQKVERLISLGDLSALGIKIGRKHCFGKKDLKGSCNFYGRDGGETGVEAQIFPTLDQLLTYYQIGHVYLFESNCWFYRESSREAFNLLEAAFRSRLNALECSLEELREKVKKEYNLE